MNDPSRSAPGVHVAIDGAKGLAVGDYNTVFNVFGSAPAPLASLIRRREFKALVDSRRDFVGRDKLLADIAGGISDPEVPSGYVTVQGEPGIGKTALMAELIRREGYVHHFNSRPLGITSARAFLSNLCAQLIVRYRLDYAALPAQATEDGGFLLRLLDEASEQRAAGGPPVVVAIDALDEADDVGLPAGANRLFLPPVLPAGVFIVVTTRPQYDYRLYVESRRDIHIRENGAENLQDVRAYITAFVTRNAARMTSQIRAWATTDDQFVDMLVTKSEGNFMYLVHVLRDIRDGSGALRSINSLNQLPQGLRAYYQQHWNAMRSADPIRFERYEEPVVCLLATAKEPVTIDHVLSWTREYWRRRGWNPVDVTVSAGSEVIKRWWEFLDRDDVDGQQRFRVYHASFQDFLREEVGLTAYDNAIADSALAKIPGFHNGT
jgi:hypothetical protein